MHPLSSLALSPQTLALDAPGPIRAPKKISNREGEGNAAPLPPPPLTSIPILNCWVKSLPEHPSTTSPAGPARDSKDTRKDLHDLFFFFPLGEAELHVPPKMKLSATLSLVNRGCQKGQLQRTPSRLLPRRPNPDPRPAVPSLTWDVPRSLGARLFPRPVPVSLGHCVSHRQATPYRLFCALPVLRACRSVDANSL